MNDKKNYALNAYKKSMNPAKKTDINTEPKTNFKKVLKPEHKTIKHGIQNISKQKISKGLLSEALKDARGYRKVAKFLVLIGKDEAAKVLKNLSNDEIEEIIKEIAEIKTVNNVEAHKILEDFGIIAEELNREKGGIDTAKEILQYAFGEHRAESIINKVLPFEIDRPFGFLNDLNPEIIINLVKKEPPMILGIIIPYLDPDKASKILQSLPLESQKIIIKKMATKHPVSEMAIAKIEQALREKIRRQSKIVTQDIDGRSILAEILKHSDSDIENKLISEIQENDPATAKMLREKLYSIDIIHKIEDKDFAQVLRDFDEKEIALLKKGKVQEIKDKIDKNISERRKELIGYEYDLMGAVSKKEVEDFAKEFIEHLLKLESEGNLIINRKQEKYIK